MVLELMFLKSVDFVVPDDRLNISTKAFTQLKTLTPCPNPAVCPTSSQESFTPPPAFHMHVKASSETTVGLYPQSETLWFLPQFNNSLASPGTVQLPSHFVLASNQIVLPPWRSGRGGGVFKSNQYPLIVPKAHVLLEAFLRLYGRDFGKRTGRHALAMICYVEEYIDDDKLLDASKLPEPLKTFYMELREGTKPVRQWSSELKKALEADSEEDGGRRIVY